MRELGGEGEGAGTNRQGVNLTGTADINRDRETETEIRARIIQGGQRHTTPATRAGACIPLPRPPPEMRQNVYVSSSLPPCFQVDPKFLRNLRFAKANSKVGKTTKKE